MKNILTTEAAMNASPQLLRTAIDQRITKIRPMATPVDQISRLAGSKHAPSMEVAYYSVDSKDTNAKVLNDVNLSFVEKDEDLGVTFKLKVDRADIFSPSDTVMFPEHKDNNTTVLTGYITSVNKDSGELQIAILDKYDGSINKNDTVVRMGRAATELDVQTPPFISCPTRKSNYCQIFKMQVEQSTLMRLADKEVGWTFNEQEEAAVIDMRLGMEKNFLFGQKGRILDHNKQEHVYFTQGIWDQAANSIIFPLDSGGVDDFITLTREIFTGNNGSRKRLLIGGSKFIETISKLKLSDKIIVGNMHSKWGLETREITTNFGSLYILHSEIFDQCGHASDAFVLDQAFVTKYSHIPFKPEKLNLRAAGARNTDAVVLTEASCLVLRNPKAHARIIGQL